MILTEFIQDKAGNGQEIQGLKNYMKIMLQLTDQQIQLIFHTHLTKEEERNLEVHLPHHLKTQQML